MSEELLQQLIHMVAENNRLVKETQQELRGLRKRCMIFGMKCTYSAMTLRYD